MSKKPKLEEFGRDEIMKEVSTSKDPIHISIKTEPQATAEPIQRGDSISTTHEIEG